MAKEPEMTASDLHQILTKNLKGVDEGRTPPARGHAIARLGGVILSNVKMRLDVRAQVADGKAVPDDLASFIG